MKVFYWVAGICFVSMLAAFLVLEIAISLFGPLIRLLS